MSKTPAYDITQTLYQKASSGKVYQWSIAIEHDTTTDKIYIVTTHGTQTGKKTTAKREVPKGKAKRTKFEQAMLEATRKWVNKHEKEGYQPSLDTATKAATKGSATDTNFLTVRPMLAQTYGKAKSPEFPVLVQRKYDGLRCIAHRDPTSKIVTLKTRNNKPYQHLDSIRTNVATLLEHAPPNLYIDGELYTTTIPFEEISGIARKKTIKKSDQAKMEHLNYHIYDCVDLDNLSQNNTDRLVTLQKIFKAAKFPKKLRLAPTFIANTPEELAAHHHSFTSDGYEGTMIRNPDGHYQINKRSNYLQKLKDFMEEEFEIVGAHEETGENKGCVVWECKTKEGVVFSSSMNGTRELRRDYFANYKKYIGKQATIVFQEYTGKDTGAPRFPKIKAIRCDLD